jgi:hypothetical protein
MALMTLKKTPSLMLARDAALLIARVSNVGDPYVAEQVNAAQRETVKREGHLTMISLLPVSDTMGQISEEAKKKSLVQIQSLGKDLVAQATVVLGKGIGSTIIRTYMSGLTLLAKSPAPHKTFALVDDSLNWLTTVPRAGFDIKGVTAAELLRYFELEASGRRAA